MLKNHHELLEKFTSPVYQPHPAFPHLNTYASSKNWISPSTLILPNLQIVLHEIDYLETPHANSNVKIPSQLQFQQDTFRLWYQIDGNGILQNVTRKIFGTARPGLLGVMDRGERHTYLHQRGQLSAFLLRFSLIPSSRSKCFWNANIEGKTILDESEQLYFGNRITSLFLELSQSSSHSSIKTSIYLLEIIDMLFEKRLIVIEESRFPRNKSKSLVARAKEYMNVNYATLHHQNSLEDECGVDINYLNILFKKESGNTLYHYLTSVRLEHAKHLLETTDKNVADIAGATGYPNANSFTRAFKRFEKVSPTSYRSRQLKLTNK